MVSSNASIKAPAFNPPSLSIPLPIVDVLRGKEGDVESATVSQGLRLTLDGRKGHTISSLRARVGGHPKRFLFTAKKPSIAAVPGQNKSAKKDGEIRRNI